MNCRLTVGILPADSWPTVGRQYTDRLLGELFFTFTLSFPDKCGVLVYWLLLFLFSRQCGFSVTDSAVEMLLKLLSRFFWVLGTFDENSAMALIAKRLPNSLYKLRKHLGLMNEDQFLKYVVCPKCKSLYDYKDCIQSRCGRKVSARCKFVAWSRHPHRRKRSMYLSKAP